jgi:two-component system phosphate regulon sensor histidine kinase PhoR
LARPKPLFWIQFLPLLAAVVVSVGTASWYAAAHLRRFNVDAEVADLEAAAHLALFRLAELIPGDPEALRRLCREMGAQSDRRITLVLPGGQVACDSEVERVEPGQRQNEITAALAGRVGQSLRYSPALGRSYIYVAVPLRRGTEVAAALRLGLPFSSVEDRLRTVRAQLATAALAMVLLGAAASYLIARWLAHPIEKLRRAVDRYADGDLHAPLPTPRTLEISALGNALRKMAGQLEGRIDAIEVQRRLQEAILGGMAEGVLAVEPGGRLLLANRTAAAMLGQDPAALPGALLREIRGATPVAGFAARVLEATEPLEEEAAAGTDGTLLLHLRGAPLHDRAGERIGVLLVLNDVSRLLQLERARRDFVTNISHELKTPVTTIAGYVELLLDGLLDDRAGAERCLETVRRQVERLGGVLDDLLVLSRLEHQTGEGPDLEPGDLCDILAEAVESTRAYADQASVSVEVSCPPGITVAASPLLLARALGNLLQNAVAHSDPGGRVLLTGTAAPRGVVVSVRDWGSGIAPEHLPRIFERFYRVDAGRSRRRGGSGLGLAIVKHIAIAHGGTVTVESAPGEGSTFTISLPTPDGSR